MNGIQVQIRHASERMTPSMRRIVRRAVDPLLRPVSSVDGARGASLGLVALTYDDGPDPETTPAVLEALHRHRTSATFFMLAERAVRHPGIVRDVVAAGHEVALHGVDHQRLTSLDPEEVTERLVRGRDMLEDLVQQRVRWFRPPYGAQNMGTNRAIKKAGLDPVVWTAAGKDWVEQEPDEVVGKVMRSLGSGGTVLLHDAFACDPREEQLPDPLREVRGAITDAILTELAAHDLMGTSVGSLVESGSPHRTAWFRP